MTDQVIVRIREEIAANVDRHTKESARRFFREEVNFHGIRTAVVRDISKRYYQEVRDLENTEVFALCEQLLGSGYGEEEFIAYDWAERMKDSFEPADFRILERWLGTYVSNWAGCDTLCNHAVGSFVERYPEYIDCLKQWAKSDNRWMRRGAAVSLVLPAQRGKFLPDIFEIAEILLADKDDLVQKGYGWMLKEASKAHRDEVFDFVIEHKDRMPRTALRYAVEKMPDELRNPAMVRGV